MANLQSLLADASQLQVAERIELIEALWETVPGGSLPPLSAEWLAEIQKRSAEYDAGSAATFSWEEIEADALRRVPRKPD